MNTFKFAKKLAIPLFVALAYGPAQGLAEPLLVPELSGVAVLGGGSVTSVPTNETKITGNLLNTGDSITGFDITAGVNTFINQTAGVTGGAGIVNGVIINNTQFSLDAQTKLLAASTALGYGAGTATDLGLTFAPGTYDFGAGLLGSTQTITLDGALPSLNGTSGSSSVWIFKFTSTLTVDQGSEFVLKNIGTGPDVGANVGIYWNVKTGATLNGDEWAGNVLAKQLISTNGNLQMDCGRLLSATAVTFDGALASSVSIGCDEFSSVNNGFDGGTLVPVPEPETYAMLLAGLGLMGFVARRRQRNLAAAA